MKLRALRATACATAVLAGGLAGCSGGPYTTLFRSVSPAPGVTVRLPASAGAVTAAAAPDSTAPLTAQVHLADGLAVPSAIAVLAPPRHLAIRGQFPAAGVVLTFRVRPGSVSPGTRPFLASLDPATRRWVPVASTYDAAAGTVRARVTHFSVWAVLDWVRSEIAGILRGALSDIFGPIESGPGGPVCASGTAGGVIPVGDSQPGGAIGALRPGSGPGRRASEGHQPAALSSRPALPSRRAVSVPSADVFAQLGEDLNNLSSAWHDRVLLPGGTEASATMTLPAAHYAVLVTEMDTEAYLTGILGTALDRKSTR